MKRILAVAALAAVAGLAAPAQADLTVCPGGATVHVGDTTVVDQHLDCIVVPLP
jgi:hypothetical protein